MIAPGPLARSSRDLGALLAMGHPLLEALGRVRLRASGALAALLALLEDRVRQGSTLAAALQGCPVPQSFQRAVQAGEAAGDLPLALQQAADLLDSAEWRRLALQASLAYPRLLLVVGLAGGLVLALGLPLLLQTYASEVVNLPAVTRLALALGWWLSDPLVLAGLLLGLVCLDALLAGRWGLDSLRLRIPVLGTWIRRQETVTCLEWLDYLLTRRLPLDEALRVSAGACSSPAFRGGLEALAGEVSRGSSLVQARSVRVFPATAAWLVGEAERREFPPGLLARVGRTLQREVDLSSHRGLALVEPLAMVAVGALVAFLLVAWLLPLYQLVGRMS